MGWKKEYYQNARRVRRWTFKLQDAYRTSSWDQAQVASGYLGSLVVELDNLIVDSLRTYAIALVRRHQSTGHAIRRLGTRSISGDEFNALVLEFSQPQAYGHRGRPLSVGRRQTPNLRDPSAVYQVLTRAGVRNLSDFGNAVSLNFSVFSEIKHPRHYYAHRNFNTFDVARRNAAPIASGLAKTPEEYLHFRDPASRVTKFVEWTLEVRTFFDVATP